MEKKTLNCSEENKPKLWDKYPVTEMDITKLWVPVPFVDVLPQFPNKPFKENLINDIKENGMFFPIMIVHSTKKELLHAKKVFKDGMFNLPFWHNDKRPSSRLWSVWGGSQRIDVAQKLGYTHIDCAIIPTVVEAHNLQEKMRKPFNDKYYT